LCVCAGQALVISSNLVACEVSSLDGSVISFVYHLWGGRPLVGKRRVARGAAAAAIAAKRDAHVVPQLPYPGDPVKKGERSSLFRVLARTPFNSSVRAPAGASEDGAAPNHLCTCHRRTCARALSPRALTRSRYGGAALGLPSRDRRMLRARTQRAARRNQHRMWSLG
jgi:hypothetical protein